MATPRKKPEDKLKSGRPPKTEVEPAVAEAICANLEIGMPLDLAAECEGVPRSTVHRWMVDFPDFLGRITCARAVGARMLHRQSLDGRKEEKSASMAGWHLERRFREFYGIPKNEAEPTEVRIIIEGGLPKRPT